jgi:hypothetical protein
MSRGQMGQVFGTASKENQTYNTNANTSFNAAQGDVANFADTVGAFKAANPYVQGGQAQTVENQQLSDTAAGGAQALGQTLQSAAVRGGQNPNAAIAASEKVAENNQRTLAGEEAGATERRLGAQTGYNEAGMEATGKIATLQDQLAEQQGQLGQGALGTEQKAAETPSFWDELGQGLISAGGQFARGYGEGKA